MSPDTITPAGGVAELERPPAAAGDVQRVIYSYRTLEPERSFHVPVPALPAGDVLLEVDVAIEDGAVVMSAQGVDVAVEAESLPAAFSELVDAVRAWLEFLRDRPDEDLVPELEEQRRYLVLLEHDPATWFGRLYLR